VVRRIEGYVIVSEDGKLADANGEMPNSIKNDADQRFFQAELDRAAAIVHGRHSHEGGPRAGGRKRLIVTRQIAAIAPDAQYPNALLWNPSGATLAAALDRLGAGDGTVAVIGGPEVFSLFLPLYDAFHLSHASKASIPGGQMPFTEAGPGVSPDDVLRRHGFEPGPPHDLDKEGGVFVVTWRRRR